MAPRKASASAAAPSASGQPKSSRQQFTACGACRMRRVKCDLKTRIKELEDADKDISHASCSNCMERNLKCIDENAEIKTQKLLRRGRRLQQVAAIYGKDVEYISPRMPSASTSSCIPTLQREMFESHFYRAFSIQYPILDSAEFAASYDAYLAGNRTALTLEGQLCAKILVIWAASFGVDPSGTPSASGTTDGSLSSSSQLSPASSSSSSRAASNTGRQRVKEMLREALGTVDVLGVMRKPSWDGVRALMLLLPLVEGAQPTAEQITMRETMMNQVHTLCSLSRLSKADYADSLARARLFWYAYVYEGVHTALRGGRLVLDEDDLAAFQRTLPPFSKPTTPAAASSARATSAASPPQAPSPAGSMASSSPSSSTSPSPSPAPPSLLSSSASSQSRPSPAALFHSLTQTFTIPLRVSMTCRRMRAALLGPKAARRDTVDEEALVGVWAGLARCWDELEGMRTHAARASPSSSMDVADDSAEAADTERFVARWQLFVFQCHNVIRESLHQRRTSLPPPTTAAASIEQLYLHAASKCASYLPHVLDTLHFHHQRAPVLGFLAYDATCVPDAVFYAGLSLAQRDASALAALDGSTSTTTTTTPAALVEEGVSVCLTALQGSRWVFGQRETEQRVGAIRLAWGEMTRRGQQQQQQFLSQHQQHQAIVPQHVQEMIPMKLEPGGPEISLDAYTTARPPPQHQQQQQFLFEVSSAVAPSALQHQQPHHHQQQHPMSLSISIPPSSARDTTMLASAASTMDDGTLSSAATAIYTRFYTPPLTGSSSSASSSPTIELFHQYQPSPEQQHHSHHHHHAQALHTLFSDPSALITAADDTIGSCAQLDQSGAYGYALTDTGMPHHHHHHPYHAHAHDPSPGMEDSSSVVSAYAAPMSIALHDPTQQYSGGSLYAPEPAYAMS